MKQGVTSHRKYKFDADGNYIYKSKYVYYPYDYVERWVHLNDVWGAFSFVEAEEDDPDLLKKHKSLTSFYNYMFSPIMLPTLFNGKVETSYDDNTITLCEVLKEMYKKVYKNRAKIFAEKLINPEVINENNNK